MRMDVRMSPILIDLDSKGKWVFFFFNALMQTLMFDGGEIINESMYETRINYKRNLECFQLESIFGHVKSVNVYRCNENVCQKWKWSISILLFWLPFCAQQLEFLHFLGTSHVNLLSFRSANNRSVVKITFRVFGCLVLIQNVEFHGESANAAYKSLDSISHT